MNKISVIFTDGLDTWDMNLTKDEISLITEMKTILDGKDGDKTYRVVDFHFNLDSCNFTFFIEEE